jgi:hypothetical protein
VNATNSDYTITQIGFERYGIGYDRYGNGYYVVGGQVDFRVQAQIGYYSSIKRESLDPWSSVHPNYTYFFVGESSEYSSIQTITIPPIQWEQNPLPTTPQQDDSTNQAKFQTSIPTQNQQAPENIPLFGLSLSECDIIVSLSVTAAVLLIIAVFVNKRRAS